MLSERLKKLLIWTPNLKLIEDTLMVNCDKLKSMNILKPILPQAMYEETARSLMKQLFDTQERTNIRLYSYNAQHPA